ETEDRARAPDPQAECEYDRGGKPGVLAEHANGVRRVTHAVVEWTKAAAVARIFLVPLESTEVAHRRAARLLGAHAVSHPLGRLAFDMVAHFGVHCRFEGRA